MNKRANELSDFFLFQSINRSYCSFNLHIRNKKGVLFNLFFFVFFLFLLRELKRKMMMFALPIVYSLSCLRMCSRASVSVCIRVFLATAKFSIPGYTAKTVSNEPNIKSRLEKFIGNLFAFVENRRN